MQSETRQVEQVDILVIGGGIVGSAILRELARYEASVVLLERNPDICDGTSKSNSAIVHTGFDAPPGTLEARLLAEARELWPQVIERLHIPYLQTGALVVATSEEELATLEHDILPKAARNGVTLPRLSREEILENAPYISPGILGGALIEGEGVIDPFWTTRAYCESAILNGAQVYTGEAVTAMTIEDQRMLVQTSGGRRFSASLVVNAAGLWSDEVARLVGDDSFTLKPRKGQFIIVEEDHGVSQIVLPVPNRISKGILVTPIVFGGVLLGPTAEEVESKADFATTAEGLETIREGIGRLVPSMTEAASAGSVRQFAGLRAVSSTGEYIIRYSTVCPRLLHVAGIRSTGISASPALGRYVGDIVKDALGLSRREYFIEELPEYLSEARAGEGDVVCLCRSITRGELLAALRSPLPPTTLDGLKRRTGAMLGECQGNLCIPRLMELFQQQLGRDPLALNKNAEGSSLVVARLAGEEGGCDEPHL
ncbi:MAG TPA: NAD(P)/FAD-dependent oxidoreductase [Ktedonobacteraceae bacterium]|nr:NAD(P)/FAD-dependent oxidoreductase [Ktedonobacteraceae bacterium]